MMSKTYTRSLEGAVYNEVVNAWMVPHPDPYTLANFQKAYNNLAAGKSAQALTKSQATEFAAAKKLAPTHYALKIYPKSEEEQWRVEMMEDVQVAYIPFDYVQLTHEEAEKVAGTRKKSAARTFAEKSPYTVTYDYTDVTDGGPTGPVTYQLPILYTVWPISKPLPDDLEYVIDYEVFLPRATLEKGTEAIAILENEAVSSALGVAPVKIIPSATRAIPTASIIGSVKTYDNTSGVAKNVPMTYLGIRYVLGSNTVNGATNSIGGFSLGVSSVPPGYGHLFYFVFRDPQQRWTIKAKGSSAPFEIATYVSDTPHTGTNHVGDIILNADSRRATDIHRAASYYYYEQNIFPERAPSGGVSIIAHEENGRSFYSPGDKVICFYNSGTTSQVIGTTMHEIAHLVHHMENTSRFSNTHPLFQESFACFVGWYLGEEYYKSVGWVKPSADLDITNNARQRWTRDTNEIPDDGLRANDGWYSPLFVDLMDDFNQITFYPSLPNDTVSSSFRAATRIWDIMSSYSSWTDIRASLLQWVESSGNMNTPYRDYLTDNFDYWFPREIR